MQARAVGTLDCETDPFKEGRLPVPFLWGFYLVHGRDEEYHEFPTREELVTFLSCERIQRLRPLIYAHNGGRFDYHYLLPDMNSDEPIMVIAGRIAKFRIGTVEFRDSYNLLPAPLRAFAKEEIDYAKLEAEVRHLHMDEIRRYLRSDCINLYEFVRRHHERFGKGLTYAGAVMKEWANFAQVRPPQQTAADFVRYQPYYFGGRVQCFQQGVRQVNFAVADIRSAYPYAMLHKHPFSPCGIAQDHLPADDNIGPCLISLDAIAKGCFPLRDERESLYFPHDETTVRTYHVTGWELLAALELDAVKIIRIRDVHRFVEHVDFAAYMQDAYREKYEAEARGDKAGREFAKRRMTGLYGKFGADPSKYEEWTIATSDTFVDCTKQGFEFIREWPDAQGGMTRFLMQRPLPEHRHRYYNVATAASITGFVRAHLFKALRACSGAIYCDTDSIAAQDVSSLPVGPDLGQWQIEMQCDAYAVAGKKLYALRDVAQYDKVAGEKKNLKIDAAGRWHKVACKGAKLSPEDIQRVASGETVLFNPLVPSYSLSTLEPQFVDRSIKRTARDISVAPDALAVVQ